MTKHAFKQRIETISTTGRIRSVEEKQECIQERVRREEGGLPSPPHPSPLTLFSNSITSCPDTVLHNIKPIKANNTSTNVKFLI